MTYFYVKALHIIFVVTWFSGMFYLVRLFVYHREAVDQPEPAQGILRAQYSIMIRRLLFGITFPSAILTLILGSWMFYLFPGNPTWLHLKIGLVVLLYGYHFSLHRIANQQRSGNFQYSSNQLRMWNEVPTILLVGIVMLVVVKQNLSLVYGLAGLFLFVAVLMIAIRVYKKIREKKG